MHIALSAAPFPDSNLVAHSPDRSVCPCSKSSGGPKFMFKDGSKWLPNGQGFWASLLIYDVDAGIGKVMQKVGNTWEQLDNMSDIGQQVRGALQLT